jgi:hypothetical protein
MEWIKMKCDAAMDPKIKLIRREYGFAGDGRWWELCRIVGRELRPTDTNAFATYHIKDWAISLGLKVENCKKFLGFLQDFCGISLTYVGDILTISIPKVLELRDSRNRARHVDKSKSKKKSKSKSEEGEKPAAPDAPKGTEKKPKAQKRRVPQSYLDARDTGTWPSKDKDALVKAAKKHGYLDSYAYSMFCDFVNKKEASGYEAIDWVAAFRNQCDGVKNKGWDGPKGRITVMDNDPGLGMENYLKEQAAETKAKQESGYYD